LRADIVHVSVDASGGDNLPLSSNDIGAATDYHVGRDALHDIWATRLADADNHTVLDANIGLVYTGPIDYQGVGDHHIECLRVRTACGLTHAFAQRLAATELAFVAVRRQVLLHLDPEVCAAEADEVASRGTEHGGVCCAVHLEHVDVYWVDKRVRAVGKAGLLEACDDVLDTMALDGTGGEVVAAADHLAAANLNEGDRLGIARLKAHGRAGGDVETVAIGFAAVKLELRVHLDEVVVRADLNGAVASARDAQADARAVLVHDNAALNGDDGTGLAVELVLGVGRQREGLIVRDGQEAAVEGAAQVAVVGGDGVVDGDEVGAHGKRALDLNLPQSAADGGQDMATPEHG